MTDRRPFLLDCDTGIDDALALLWLLADDTVDLRGISCVYGNIGVAEAAQNTLRLLVLAGQDDVPVAIGAAAPFTSEFDGGATHVHGANGIGNITLSETTRSPVTISGAELIVQTARAHPGELRVLAIGPLTNLARALELEPELPSLIAELTIMGGAALAPGNVSFVAEANIGNDPVAAARVLAAGWPVVLVPLDTTMRQVMEESDRQRLLADPRPVPQAMAAMLEFYFGFYRQNFGRLCAAMHDPLAAAIATGAVVPTLAPRVTVVVDETDGPGRGQTLCDLRGRYLGYPDQPGAHCRVVLETPPGFATTLVDRILTLF